MRELTVKYVGNDLEYWRELKAAFKEYEMVSPTFLREEVGKDFHPPASFMKNYEEKCDIIYVDFSVDPLKGLSLCKLLCRNNETRLRSVVGLHETKGGTESLLKGALAGVRLNYYKGLELEDVVYHPISLLDSSAIPARHYAEGAAFSPFKYAQILRLGYISDDHFRVETNSPLENNGIVELDGHPLEDVMASKRFYVQNYSDSDLYYNQRYSYNLKYTYVDSGFFKASESSWLAYRNEDVDPKTLKGEAKKRYDFILRDVQKRRAELVPIREDIQKWVDDHESEYAPKRLKVLVIDETLDIFKEYDGNLDSFNYTINFQTKLTKDFYQIRRSRPHLIVFHFEPTGNNRVVLSHVVEQIKKFENYEPVILVFNCHDNSSVLQSLNEYEHIISYKNEVHLDTIRKMSGILDERFHITDPEGKVFLKTNDPMSVATLEREAKILKFNESELYFETRYEIPMWTTFIMREPLNAFITVLPMGNHSPKFNSTKHVYRALFNGVGEKEKSQIRRLVNESLR